MRQSKRYPMYWKPYMNLEHERAVGLFNWRFSDKISLGRVKKVQDDPEKWEGLFTIDPMKPEKFDSEALAKEWVEEQVLLWTMKGNSLAEYYSNPETEGEDEMYEVEGAEPTEYAKKNMADEEK